MFSSFAMCIPSVSTEIPPQIMIHLTPVLPTTVAVVQFPNVQKATDSEAVIDVMNTGISIRASPSTLPD